MRITFASGKGGTGKTTLATNLAVALADCGSSVLYVDCDVEEPNGGIFLNPTIEDILTVTVPAPKVTDEKCTYCGVCADICQFNALAVLEDKVMVFDELCHSCGGCMLMCPEKAIYEDRRRVGSVRVGRGTGLGFVEGRLDVGEPQPPPVISAAKSVTEGKTRGSQTDVVIVDAPPGTSCSVIEAVKGSDYVVLVTEPTPFGLHDLKLAVSVMKRMNLPFGVAINRDEGDSDAVVDYCVSYGGDILAHIPFSRGIAEICSRGELPAEKLPEYRETLLKLYRLIDSEATA